MSMFSFFRRSTNVTQPEVQSPKEQVIPDADSDDGKESFDSIVEVSGGKGWPTNATVLLYHKKQGLICIGTEGGSIYVYGDGFQYMRPWLTEEANEVVSIVALYPNRILVAFGDNSLVVMELPTLEVIDLLRSSSWMNPKWGDITAIHCDMPNEKNFIYVGTSEGYLTVLDVMESAVRVCDFELTTSDFSLQGQSFSISDIQSCPKDERFLAIGFDGANANSGAVAVYDLNKHKILKLFNTSGISTIQWHHSGEVLYAGTRTGEILYIHPEKGTCTTSWSAKDEKIDDEDEDENTSALYIRRISWLAPQEEGAEGCLFVLIATNNVDNDNLKNVIIGLHPGNLPGELNTIFALPPISYEKIISFRVVPTYNKSLKETATSIEELEKTAGLLLLVQRQMNGRLERQLYILRCPTVEIKDWALEMGALPDPRKAREVQPAAADITATTGVVPNFKNPSSLGKALLTSAFDQEQVVSTALTQKAPAASTIDDVFAVPEEKPNKSRMSRRISARQFYETQVSLNELEASLKDVDSWEMVLVNGEHEENTEGVLRQQDVVFNGHADGTIIAYGVSMPDTRKEFGKASIWLPVTALRCGTTAVTSIHADEQSGLLLSGDEEGFVVLHEVYDKQTNIGAIDLVKKIYDQTFAEAEELVSSLNNGVNSETPSPRSDKAKKYTDFAPDHFLKDTLLYDYNHFNGIREVYRTKLSQHITSSLILGSFMILVVGTAEGTIFVSNDLRSPMFSKVEKLDLTGASGAVKGLDLGYYYHKSNYLCVIYAYFESGHIVVIDIQTMTVVAYTVAFGASKAAIGNDRHLHNVGVLPIVNAAFHMLNKPTVQSYAYLVTRTKYFIQAARFTSSGSFDSTTSEGSSRPQSTLLQSQSATAPNIGGPNNTPPPPVTATVQKRSFFGSMRVTKEAPTSPTPSVAAVASTSSNNLSPFPEKIGDDISKIKLIEHTELEVPKYLIFIAGNTISTVALSKFLIPAMKTTLQNTASAITGVQTTDLSQQSIISTQLYYLPDKVEAEDALAEDDGEGHGSPRKLSGSSNKKDLPRAAYLACVDNEGLLRLVSFKSRKPVHHVNLLEGVISTESNEDDEDESRPLYCASLLPNGNNYLVGKGVMQYSSTLIFVDEEYSTLSNLLGSPLPERAIPTSKELDKTLALLHGREQMILNLKAQLKKRRSSVINLSAAPTDLYKIFQKTREQRSKDELFSKESGADDESSYNNAQKSKMAAGKVKNELDQLKENFAERGERINRIALKMDDFKQQAMDYRQTVKEQKEKLQKRNTRWGLF